MRVLLIDDIRNEVFIAATYGIEVSHVAKNFTQGIISLVSQKWDLLLLDHDLSSYVEDVEKTGYDVMLFLEKNPEYLPGEIMLVTSNPVGRDKMNVVIKILKEQGLLK